MEEYMEAVKEEEKKEETPEAIPEETEFLKGWDSETDDSAKVEASPEPEPITPDPEPEKKEPVEGKEPTEDKQIEPDPKTIEPDKTVTSEPAKPDAKEVEEDENSITNYQRWRTAQGIIQAAKTNQEKADKKIKELEDKLNAKPEVKPDEKKAEEDDSELDKLEDKYFDAMLADNKDEARGIRKQINDIRFDRLSKVSQQEATAIVNTELTNKTLTEAVAQVKLEAEKQYPFLDVTKPNTSNPYAVRLVQAVRDDYRSQGLSFADALKRAVEEVAPLFTTKAVTTAPIEEPKGEPVDKDKLESTVVVKSGKAPVKVGGKSKGPTTFDEGFDSVT